MSELLGRIIGLCGYGLALIRSKSWFCSEDEWVLSISRGNAIIDSWPGCLWGYANLLVAE